MKVKFAKTAGFCMGVRRAMEMVLAEANRGEGPLFTFGPLIHNNQVLDLLESKGVRSVEDLDGLETGRIVIRAHGIPPQKRQDLKDTGLKIIDATCPRVARVQAIIRYHTKKGYTAVIVGDKDHAEVIGLMGYSKGPVHVIQGVEDVSTLAILDRVFVVAQTTQNEKNYREVVKALKEQFPDVLVFDTICDATHQRQREVRSLKDQVDALVVVGGYHSGNTQRLVEVSRRSGIPTFHVETEKDLDKENLLEMQVIGVTAGHPHSTNPCLGQQLRWAASHSVPAHAYIVVAWPTASELRRARGGRANRDTLDALRAAGRAQARSALNTLSSHAFRPPMVWLDVETIRSRAWPTGTAARRTANRALLLGVMRGLADAGFAYGLYSYARAWRHITGRWRLPGVPVWATAGRRHRGYCGI